MKLIISLLITLGTGVLAGYITAGESSGQWYTDLSKPSFQPPNWLFAPVWTVLYIMMGLSFWLIWRQPASRERNMQVSIFLFQLLLNFLWSIFFFNFHMIGIALIDIVALWVMILVTIFSFRRVSKTAAWLLVPYLLWVSFATVLNWKIYTLN